LRGSAGHESAVRRAPPEHPRGLQRVRRADHDAWLRGTRPSPRWWPGSGGTPRRRSLRRRSNGGRATASEAWKHGAGLGSSAAAGLRRFVALSLTLLVGGGSPAGVRLGAEGGGGPGGGGGAARPPYGWRGPAAGGAQRALTRL